LPEKDDEAGRLDKAEEVPRSEFPAEEDANIASVASEKTAYIAYPHHYPSNRERQI
jgi:hypothetical protein